MHRTKTKIENIGMKVSNSISLKSNKELAFMKEAGAIVADVMQTVVSKVDPGITTKELDDIALKEISASGAKPAFLGYLGFPACFCISVNDEIVHGIPSDRKLFEGDIVSIDGGVIVNGYYSDHAVTVPVGKITEKLDNLIFDTRKSLYKAIELCKEDNRIGDIGNAIESYIIPKKYGLVREYVGHGIGRNLHEGPQIPNYGEKETGLKLNNGMVIAIEPMINIGGEKTVLCDDGWTVKTADGSQSAHFEHTVAITEEGPIILTENGDKNG